MSSFNPGDQSQEMGNWNKLSQNAGANQFNAGHLLHLGNTNTNAGANFFRNLMGGNQADTISMLQPDIDRNRAAQQQTLQAVSTLMPRGGARSSTLFQLPFQTNQNIQALFNQGRVQGAQALPQIGAQQGSLGSNLFNLSNQAAAAQSGMELENRKAQQQFWTNLVGAIIPG